MSQDFVVRRRLISCDSLSHLGCCSRHLMVVESMLPGRGPYLLFFLRHRQSYAIGTAERASSFRPFGIFHSRRRRLPRSGHLGRNDGLLTRPCALGLRSWFRPCPVFSRAPHELAPLEPVRGETLKSNGNIDHDLVGLNTSNTVSTHRSVALFPLALQRFACSNGRSQPHLSSRSNCGQDSRRPRQLPFG
jgi:hypothetical protein